MPRLHHNKLSMHRPLDHYTLPDHHSSRCTEPHSHTLHRFSDQSATIFPTADQVPANESRTSPGPNRLRIPYSVAPILCCTDTYSQNNSSSTPCHLFAHRQSQWMIV